MKELEPYVNSFYDIPAVTTGETLETHGPGGDTPERAKAEPAPLTSSASGTKDGSMPPHPQELDTWWNARLYAEAQVDRDTADGAETNNYQG